VLFAQADDRFNLKQVSVSMLSLPKTPFSLGQLNLDEYRYTLHTTCSPSFSRCFLRFGKAFGPGRRSKQRKG
jgi:hypothetical protein